MKKLTDKVISQISDIAINATGSNNIEDAINILNSQDLWADLVDMLKDPRIVGVKYKGPTTMLGVKAAVRKAQISYEADQLIAIMNREVAKMKEKDRLTDSQSVLH